MRNLFVIILFTIGYQVSGQTIQEYYSRAIAAYDSANYEAFLENMENAYQLNHTHPTILYNVAAGHALTGNPKKSILFLRKAILLNASLPFQEDSDFASIRNQKDFIDLTEEASKLNEPLESGVVAFKLSEVDLHPEGITYHEKEGAFFVSSVRKGKIVKVQDGEVSVFRDGLPNSVMGLGIDEKNKILWACTTPTENHENGNGSIASLLKFDLKGRLLNEFISPDKEAWFGDLIVASNGDVYVTSSSQKIPAIYKYDAELNEFDTFLELNELVSLQGIALNEDENIIYLSDYKYGLYWISLSKKKLNTLQNGTEHPLKGIDGLYYNDNSLIAIHNGLKPFQVVKYKLNKPGDIIKSFEFLEKALPDMNEPTLGTIVDDDLYYIANSPWPFYDKENNFQSADASDPVIRKVSTNVRKKILE